MVSRFSRSPICWLRMAYLSFGQAERVLQLAAAGKHFGEGHGERDGVRRVAARTPHRIFAAFENLKDGIVDARADLAIVQQKGIRERCCSRGHASSLRLTMGSSLILPLVITSASSRFVEEQMMQRRVRQHQAQPRVPGRDACGDGGIFAARQQHDGPPVCRRAARARHRRGRRAVRRRPLKRPSRQKPCRCGACARAAGSPRVRWRHRKPDGIRPDP